LFTGLFSGSSRCEVYISASSVVIVEAYSPKGKIQGSGVAFRHGYKSDSSKLIKDLIPSHTFVTTNAHVVQNGSRFTVQQKGDIYPAILEYIDNDLDLAILLVDKAVLAISAPVKGSQIDIGEKVFAIGSPLGLENSITDGIISGKREKNGVLLLQTTAPISKGNSGGGLFDSKANFIGVTTFKLKDGENINFAIDAFYVMVIFDAKVSSKLLRAGAETLLSGMYSSDEMTIINSERLTKWLSTERSDNGEMLYIVVQKITSEIGSNDSYEKLEKQYKSILAKFLRDMKAEKKQISTQRDSTRLKLFCELVDALAKTRQELPIVIDYENKTVNEKYPAMISENEIRWHFRSKDITYIINRYTGSMIVQSGDFTTHTGKCYSSAEKMF
jgi:hypothetical protein